MFAVYFIFSGVPEQSHEPELLGHGKVNLVLWVPIIHLLLLGNGGLLEQLDHFHRSGVCWTHNLSKDLCTQSGHTHSIAGQTGHDCLSELTEKLELEPGRARY